MFNKDKRSMALMLLLGDGSIGCYKTDNYKTGRLTIDHGIAQADYQSWKAQLLSQLFDQPIKTRTGHKGKSIQLMVRNKKFKAWRKFTYPNGKKDLSRILPFIRQPELAIAVWLMDDGYVEPSKNKKAPSSLSARFRIFTCDQHESSLSFIQKWLEDHLHVKSKIKYSFKRSANKNYPYIKISQEDSLKLWGQIREFVLQFKSMQYKFRYIEQVYQLRVVQRIPDRRFKITTDDMIHPTSNSGNT
jgi:hypothetical protein